VDFYALSHVAAGESIQQQESGFNGSGLSASAAPRGAHVPETARRPEHWSDSELAPSALAPVASSAVDSVVGAAADVADAG